MRSNEIVDVSTNKIKKDLKKQIILGILAGMFIALAAVAATILSSKTMDIGISKFLSGIVFSMGLISVVLTGAQLFTGNIIGITSVLDKKATLKEYLKNLLIIYISNMIGALIIAVLVYYSGLLSSYSNEIAHYSVSLATKKLELSFVKAFTSGILCNILVSLAVILSMSVKETTSKIIVIVFPILAFIIGGFEHCVANMYYIPIALISKLNIDLIGNIDVSSINVGNYLFNNLLPVTIGNIVGGLIISILIYYGSKES